MCVTDNASGRIIDLLIGHSKGFGKIFVDFRNHQSTSMSISLPIFSRIECFIYDLEWDARNESDRSWGGLVDSPHKVAIHRELQSFSPFMITWCWNPTVNDESSFNLENNPIRWNKFAACLRLNGFHNDFPFITSRDETAFGSFSWLSNEIVGDLLNVTVQLFWFIPSTSEFLKLFGWIRAW